VGADLLDPERLDPVDRRPQPDRLGDLRGAGLELPRQVGPRRLVRRDGANHVPAADERRHLLEQLTPPVEHADPGWAVCLMPGPGVEVDVERRQLHRQLRDRLRPVDDHDRPGRVGAARDLGDRIDRSQHVRDVDDADQLRPALEQLVERVEIELAVVEHRDVGELGLAVLAQQLPRDDVRVVLHLGQHDQVAAIDVLATPAVRDEVQRRGRVGGEDRLLGGRVQPRRGPRASAFVQVCRLDGERVHPAVDRRPRLGVVPRHRVDHRLRRLRGRGAVEIRERPAAELPAQHRELRDAQRCERLDGAHATASIWSVIQP
jgi:hypothetical protein